jgi:hypothetical protein
MVGEGVVRPLARGCRSVRERDPQMFYDVLQRHAGTERSLLLWREARFTDVGNP